jgi:hypothetical protein
LLDFFTNKNTLYVGNRVEISVSPSANGYEKSDTSFSC